TAQIRQLIDSGGIGAVQRVSGAFTYRLALEPANIRLQPDMAGGSLLDVGCYPVYAIPWAFGAQPTHVYATARSEYEVDLDMSGLMCLEDGRVGTFDCGFTAPLRMWLEITGSEGVIHVPRMWLPEPEAGYTIFREGRDPEVRTVPGH